MKTLIGLHFSHEQHSPSALLRYTRMAADAGFTNGMCSDHLRPWSERQGHSGFAWSWLGSALAATSMSFGTVCAPGQRYNPVVIAQAAATLAEMYPDRFWLAVGSGEALNEAITGDRWPSKDERNARLKACAEVMRRLWTGNTVSTDGPVRVKAARLYVAPRRPPALLGAAISEETARWLGSWADGMITVAQPGQKLRRVVEAFRAGGGADKPMFLQVALSFATSDEEALAAAHDQWRQSTVSPEQVADLETPADFDRASAHATPEDVRSHIRVSSDIEQHTAWLQQDQALGFERIYLHNVAREHQQRFISLCASRVRPALER
jgi:coenzyme F420-dependent glucose-6-phosphate dehydrogenase